MVEVKQVNGEKIAVIKTAKVLTKKEDEKNKLRMGGTSWSINLDRYKIQDYKLVEYITPLATYKIAVDKALKVGFIRVLGGERKLVVPEKFWTTVERTKE